MSSASTGGTEGSSPASSPASAASLAMAANKSRGTPIPNRIFVGGISANTSEAELTELFSDYGTVKATKIIVDQNGVSKGYGFVTFETEEEAKRLQGDSESIFLGQRKLNIAAAVRKQSFSRSIDGGTRSPPNMPTSTYYYPNGMGLAYPNGMTFYNPGAPAPGTAIAPPNDPTAIYQAGVFGPQATTGHQPFGPMMYPCPAPSIYMPQQYQYPPMPYEPYYTGTTSAGAPQYLYPANGSPNANNGSGNGSGNGSNNTGATSPSAGPQSLPPHQPGTFYAPAASSHHHPAGGPQQQLDHLYYSYAAAPQHHPQMGLPSDQQLLLYAADASCQQQPSSDGHAQQEDTHSTSSLSEQPSGDGHAASAASQHPSSGAPLVPLPFVPYKFPIPARYPNYHPLAIHTTNLQNTQNCSAGNEPPVTSDECGAGNQMHCKAILYHHPAMYITHPHTPPFHGSGSGASLLPTPPGVPGHAAAYEMNPKMSGFNSREYAKSLMANAPYGKTSPNAGYMATGAPMSHAVHVSTSISMSRYGGQGSHKYSGTASPSFGRGSSSGQYRRNPNVGAPSYYANQKSGHYGNANPGCHKYGGYNNYNAYGTNCGAPAGPHRNGYEYANGRVERDGRPMGNQNRRQAAATKTSPVESEGHGSLRTESKNSTGESSNADKPTTPPPAPYSPMARPLPSISPPNAQVQFFTTSANRYQTVANHQQQQQQHLGMPSRRYPTPISSMTINARGKSDKYQGVQNSGLRQSKYKMNGIMQAGKVVSEDSLGGAGDAPPGVGRLLTPPGTPRTPDQKLEASCHQLQALSL